MDTLRKIANLNLLALSGKYSCFECDGLTKILSYTLSKASIAHQIKLGSITIGADKDNSFYPHFWIEFMHRRDIWIIDYRAQMWFPGCLQRVPNGVFSSTMNPLWHYQGKAVDLKVSDRDYRILVAAAEIDITIGALSV